jgi:type IV secretory pathway TrbF-like protein
MSLQTLVYDKSLRLCGVRKGNASNVLNVDPTKIDQMAYHLHRMVSLIHSLTLDPFIMYQQSLISAMIGNNK